MKRILEHSATLSAVVLAGVVGHLCVGDIQVATSDTAAGRAPPPDKIELRDSDGRVRIRIGVDSKNQAAIELIDEKGDARISISQSADATRLDLLTKNRGCISLRSGTTMGLQILDPAGSARLRATIDQQGMPSVELLDKNEAVRAMVSVLGEGKGDGIAQFGLYGTLLGGPRGWMSNAGLQLHTDSDGKCSAFVKAKDGGAYVRGICNPGDGSVVYVNDQEVYRSEE